jgi:hypothetical protein
MTRIGLLGDTHSNPHWTAGYALGKFNREGIDTILQVGDFGIEGREYGQRFLKRVNLTLEHFGQHLYFVDGNHEDFDYLYSIPLNADGTRTVRENITHFPRGYRWTWGDRSFVALGGAPSVDRHWRVFENAGVKSWWEQEYITDEDVDRTIAGGHADVMVCHDAPQYVKTIDHNIAGNPLGFHEEDLRYADEGRRQMQRAFMAVQPALFLHGHYHFLVNEKMNVPSFPMARDIKFQCQVVGLSCDTNNFSMGVLDTDDMSVEVWDIGADYREYAR